jgi:NAD(P)-dependent dehydrogenase (short-subunit alcohol dehydrogenase family)
MASKKVWFITGASRGFGRVWAEAALKRGDKVVATVRDVSAITALSANYGEEDLLVLTLDITDRPAVFSAIAHAKRHFGRLDVIVCNAGYAYLGAIEELEFEAAKANFETNVFGTLSVIQAAIPVLREQASGHIVTVSSVGGVVGFPTGGSYTASKFAIEAMTEALAGEVAQWGIKVTILEPGNFATTFSDSTNSAPALPGYDRLKADMQAGFRPEDIGDPDATAAVVFQLVEEAQPPLRLILGAHTLPMFRAVYQKRLEEWDAWSSLSEAAQTTKTR